MFAFNSSNSSHRSSNSHFGNRHVEMASTHFLSSMPTLKLKSKAIGQLHKITARRRTFYNCCSASICWLWERFVQCYHIPLCNYLEGFPNTARMMNLYWIIEFVISKCSLPFYQMQEMNRQLFDRYYCGNCSLTSSIDHEKIAPNRWLASDPVPWKWHYQLRHLRYHYLQKKNK